MNTPRDRAFAWMNGWQCATGMLGIPAGWGDDPDFLAGWTRGKVARAAAKEEVAASTGYRFATLAFAGPIPGPDLTS